MFRVVASKSAQQSLQKNKITSKNVSKKKDKKKKKIMEGVENEVVSIWSTLNRMEKK